MQRKKVLFFWGASVPSLIFLLALILCVNAVVLCWGMISGVHNTRLLAASADVRLVRKYFSSMKERALDATVVTQRTSSVPYTYYTVRYVFDGCGTYF